MMEVIKIYSKFENLKMEKQNTIINSALKEFARNGFDNASTDEIVKEAEISKGSLFNYFNSKKNLYIYLFDFSVEIVEELYEKIDVSERDLFKRIGNIGLQKLIIYQNNPYVFDFLTSVETEENTEIKEITKKKVALVYERGIKWIYKDIDYSKFREDIDINKAIEILNWTMFGFGDKIIKKMASFEDLNQFGEMTLIEWEEYSEILKNNFYK